MQKDFAAKEECEHGDWLSWLKENFGWREDTAQKYMRIGTVFGKNRPGRHLEDISIDAKALYLLSAPAIPQEVRDEALEKKTLTLKEAEALVAKAVKKAIDEQEQEAKQETEGKLADI